MKRKERGVGTGRERRRRGSLSGVSRQRVAEQVGNNYSSWNEGGEPPEVLVGRCRVCHQGAVNYRL